MLVIRTELGAQLSGTLTRQGERLSWRENQNLASAIFKQRLTKERTQNLLREVPPHLHPLYAFTLRLLAADTFRRQVVRSGSVEQVIRFCERHRLLWANWNVEDIVQNREIRVQYFQELEEALPPLGVPQQLVDKRDIDVGAVAEDSVFSAERLRLQVVDVTALVLTRAYFFHVERNTERMIIEGAMPFLVLDGPSGVGKTTVFREIQRIFEENGYPVLYLGLDMFLKDRTWRLEQERMLVEGELDAATYDEAYFFNWEGVKGMLDQVVSFRKSGDRERELFIPHAYLAKEKIYRDEQLPLRRGQVVIVEGKYANLETLQEYYGSTALHLRLRADEEEVRRRFASRDYKGVDLHARMGFYDKVLVRSFNDYAARTAHSIQEELNISPKDTDLDDDNDLTSRN